MAKGNTCPACGHLTFHQFEASKKRRGTSKRAYRKCSHCGALGWFGMPSQVGSGGGERCQTCGENKLHGVYRGKKALIRFCANRNCNAVLIDLP
jgi:hypothetical protein